ncbi:MAG: PAS domain-containing protein [Candidatus Lokiarchaeota archaeon]|nr:PAS domain-containing protein [Candidatus Lokiarchaeota archaeon]
MSKIDSYEQRFHQIVNNILDIIVEIDLKGNFTYVSPQVYDILGYYPDELIGISGFKFIHPEDLPEVLEKMKDLLKPQKINSVKKLLIGYRALHKNGHYIFLSARGSLVEIEGNMKIIAVLSDITEQLEYGQKLKESDEIFQLISDNANDIIAIVNEKFEREYINKDAYLNILGYSEGDVKGKSLLHLVHPDDFNEAKRALRKGIRNEVGIFEARVKHKNGNYIWLGIKGKMFTDKDGKRKGIMILRDIIDQKRIEQKLRESEEKFRTIIENAKEGYYEVDLKGNFTFFNNALSNLLKYSPNELMGMNFKKYMDDKNSKLTFKAFNSAYRTGVEQQHFQYELITKNGENLYGESSFSIRYDSDGRKIGFSGFLRDIT